MESVVEEVGDIDMEEASGKLNDANNKRKASDEGKSSSAKKSKTPQKAL